MIPVGFVGKEKEESSKEDLVEVFITVDTRDADYVSDRSVISAKDISIIAELDIRYSGRGVLKEINEYDYITDRIDIPRNCNYEYGPTLSGLGLTYIAQDGVRTDIEIDYKYWEKDNYKNLIESIVNRLKEDKAKKAPDKSFYEYIYGDECELEALTGLCELDCYVDTLTSLETTNKPLSQEDFIERYDIKEREDNPGYVFNRYMQYLIEYYLISEMEKEGSLKDEEE